MAIFVPKIAAHLKNIPAGNISATNVQTAINELDAEKAASTHTHVLSGGATDVTATYVEINQALDGIGPAVTAANVTTLVAGSASNADSLHTHTFNNLFIEESGMVTQSTLNVLTSGGNATGYHLHSGTDISSTVSTATSATSADLLDGQHGSYYAVAADLTTHTANASAHSASQITNSPSGNISATNVQAAINELDTEKQGVLTNSAGLAAALSDETGTGLAVFNTSPTFVTQISTPKIVSDGSGSIGVGAGTPAFPVDFFAQATFRDVTFLGQARKQE